MTGEGLLILANLCAIGSASMPGTNNKVVLFIGTILFLVLGLNKLLAP